MSNLHGNRVMLGTGYNEMSTVSLGMRDISVRNDTGNSTIFFSNSSKEPIGFLKAEESYTFHNMAPKDIFLIGTPGQFVFWNGDAS